MLSNRSLGVWEYLCRQIKHRQWARNTSASTNSDDSQVPSHQYRDKTESTCNLKVVYSLLQVSRTNGSLSCSEEGEEENQGEEDDDEGDVGAERSKKEDEGYEAEADVVGDLTTGECKRCCTGTVGSVCIRERVCWVVGVRDRNPMDTENCKYCQTLADAPGRLEKAEVLPVNGYVFPRMNSHIPAMTIAMPP